ncbi:39S ribosomal protein L12, mitochondrial [Orussus abietinus]|uniref:39S ribosomal protein L12, mitochondrial n=1 Tax=Orussus abietinus TaxID=222816 RepID=UPI000626A1BF|nr:39S ribosomal protein L12, mitochondrial [Orussus abietinus]
MMNSTRLVLVNRFIQLRQFHKCVIYSQTETAAAPIDAISVPIPEGVEKPVSAKIDKIAKDITALNLIEVAELSDLLKKRLNLPDAPIMPMGGFAMPTAVTDEEEAAPVKQVKSSFTVKLTKFDDKQKVALIKEIKNLLPGMNLVQAKKFVESAPTIVKADVAKDEAEKLKEALTNVGAVVDIE